MEEIEAVLRVPGDLQHVVGLAGLAVAHRDTDPRGAGVLEGGLDYQLSPQEAQIAQLVAEGLSNREIGHRLYLSHRTVASHLYRMFPKLGVRSRAQLGRAASERVTAAAIPG